MIYGTIFARGVRTAGRFRKDPPGEALLNGGFSVLCTRFGTCQKEKEGT